MTNPAILTQKVSSRKILVTAALPYANGALHLGHMLEHIQTDIWVRFLKSQGHQVSFVCGEDAHGASVMLKAEANGIAPEVLVEQMKKSHQKDLEDFSIEQDLFYSTHSEENRARAESIFKALEAKGTILKKNKRQLFDPVKSMFLADRFVKGGCPKCHKPDQYGDNCEACGATYEPSDLIDPKSTFSGATPEWRDAEQLYFDLPQFQDFLKSWLDSGSLQSSVANKLSEWVNQGLMPWDISRESPYFGFEIPGYPGKYFYVWLDAPIGYMASFEALCKASQQTDQPLKFDDYWQKDSTAELYHFIGKDIINFHGLFWPAMLETAGYRLPTKLFTHGFVTVNGEKMSKSRGTFITARSFLDHIDPELLRYYYASKLGNSVDDIDLNLEDFVQKVNTDLVGKIVNIASRCAKFINKDFDSTLSAQLSEEHQTAYQAALEQVPLIAAAFESLEFAKAVQMTLKIADEANRLIDEAKPWVTIKDPALHKETQAACTMGLVFFRLVMTCLTPVLPSLSKATCDFLNLDRLDWQALALPLQQHQINQFKPLMKRLDPKKILQLTKGSTSMNDSQEPKAPTSKPAPEQAKADDASNGKAEIKIDDFIKLDLRIVEVKSAESVEGADKLIKVIVDIGNDETRQIFAGMKEAYPEPGQLVGRKVLALVNLKPRKMRFGISEGMILGAGPGGEDIFLLTPDTGATTGMIVS